MRSGLDRRVIPALAASDTGTLPLDTIYEILLRLPAKDLCRLRIVCRPWQALLSDPQFIVAHATRHPGPLLIAAYRDNEKNGSLVEIMDLSGQSLKKVPKKYGDRVVSMAKDLVHVSNIGCFNSRLLNPATGTMYCFSDRKQQGASYLFGQTASKGEQKVLRRFDKIGSGRSIHELVEVFTLNNGSHAMWRKKQAPPQRVATDKWTDVVIDGVAYLLSWNAFYELAFSREVNREDMIITFDLETEEWGTILGPNISFLGNAFQVLHGVCSPIPRSLTLADLNGSLAVVCLYGIIPRMDIWISTDIAKGNWVNQYHIRFEQYDMRISYVHPVVVLDDQTLVIYIEDKELLQIYNPRSKTFTNVVELEHCSSICLYTGNLLSLVC